MRQRLLSMALAGALFLSMAVPAFAAEQPTEIEMAGAYLHEQGIYQGDSSGDLMLDKALNRIELAAILTRMMGNPEHVDAEQGYYTRQCKFSDVPEWAKLYVGYCNVHWLMVGYDNGLFGAYDAVTPAAACTVTLRYLDLEADWTYDTAVSKADSVGLVPEGGLSAGAVTRGEMAVLLYRAMGNEYTGQDTQPSEAGALSRNADGSINPPSDGSRYVPQAGDVIRCDDGTNYTITDVSRYDKNMFASGPVGELPEPTCDWSLLEQPELPAMEVRRFNDEHGDRLFVRNLYETRRMLYTLYNAIGNNPQTWANGKPILSVKGNQLVHINLSIPIELPSQVFWPWRESEIVNIFNSVPPGIYSMEAWDVYSNGIFQHTRYNIRTN